MREQTYLHDIKQF